MIVGICMVRDEQDIIGYTLHHMLNEGVDRIIVADNLSLDNTPNMLAGMADGLPITVIQDLEPGYHQDRKMTALTRRAMVLGADWIVPFDADELWYSEHGTLAQALNACPYDIVYAKGWDHLATLGDGYDRNPYRRITHRRTFPQKLPKVAFRVHPEAKLHMGNHDVDHPGDRTREDVLALRHFQYRTLAQMTSKVRNGRAAMEASDKHWNYCTHWRTLGTLNDDDLAHHWIDLCSEADLIDDPAPYRSNL